MIIVLIHIQFLTEGFEITANTKQTVNKINYLGNT